MSNLPRRLFSQQDHDLRTFKGPRDLERGTYRDHEGIRSAQRRLYDQCLGGNDQVIWCSPEELEASPLDGSKLVHEIELAESDLVAVVNGYVWGLIIELPCIPPDVHAEFRRRSCFAESPRDHVEELVRRYHEEHRPQGCLWDHVIGDLDSPMPEYLLRWPLGASEIVDVRPVVVSS